MPTHSIDELVKEINSSEDAANRDPPDGTTSGTGTGGVVRPGDASNTTARQWEDFLNGNVKPNVVNGLPTIYDPDWDEAKWANTELTLTLPKETDNPDIPPEGIALDQAQAETDDCCKKCTKTAEDAQAKCDILRRRIQVALNSQGCPSDVVKHGLFDLAMAIQAQQDADAVTSMDVDKDVCETPQSAQSADIVTSQVTSGTDTNMSRSYKSNTVQNKSNTDCGCTTRR